MESLKSMSRAIAEGLVYSPANYRLVLVVDALAAVMFLVLGLREPGSWPARIVAAGFGYCASGFLEYGMHRWVLHGAPSIARRGHARHHADDHALIASPMFMIVAVAVAVFGWASLVVSPGLASLFTFGVYFGYNQYAVAHHVMHHHEALAARVGLATLERRHRVHHDRQDVNFGITTTVWDRLLGTYEPPRAKSLRS